MPELAFEVISCEPERFATAPTLRFRLHIQERVRPWTRPTPIHSVLLRCQVRIEPARRSYQPDERSRLGDLFGAPERWGETLRPMLWTHACQVVPAFEGTTEVALPIPCSSDQSLAATRYFSALDSGGLPLCFLFSGTVFHEAADGALQAAPISWQSETAFLLPAATWHALMRDYYPNTAWVGVRRDLFQRIDHYRGVRGLASLDQALESLLAAAEEPVTP
jgi:hypothetical protein